MRMKLVLMVCGLVSLTLVAYAGQAHQAGVPQPRQQPVEDPAAVERGHALFKSSCGFCHGEDATGGRGPDLVRSALLSHDDHGTLVAPVIRNGRPEKGMPSFSTMKDDQLVDIVTYLHHQASAARGSAHVPGDYPLAKLMTGNAAAGKTYFEGAGGCAGCHSATGDLAGVAKKYSPVNLQQNMVYPEKSKAAKTAIVTLKDGTQVEGKVAHEDEFSIAITGPDGWYRSWARGDVKVEIRDPLAAHRELMNKYTDADIHDLFAYLETFK